MSAETLRRFGDELAASYESTMRRFMTLQLQGTERARAIVAELRAQLGARGTPTPQGLADALAALTAIDLRPRVGAIGQPALVVAGDRDTLVPAGAGAWLAATLPAARLASIPGAAHVPFLSHSEIFFAACEAFCDGR
jgi:pimeloyl-[acyl-carrier protein] methyl ester esterase